MIFPFLLVLSVTPAGCQIVDRDYIVAADLAVTVPAFAQMPSDFNLGYLPSSGATRTLRGADLQRIAKNRGIAADGLPDVCFQRRTFVPSAEQIRKAMLDVMLNSWDIKGAKIEIVSSSQHPVPMGEVVFPRDGIQLSQGASAPEDLLWHGTVRYDGGKTASIWAKVRITATMTRVVAVKTIPAGKPIQKNQVRLETYEGFPLDETMARTLDEVVNKVPKSPLQALTPIRKTQVERPPDVAKGDVVTVQVIGGAMRMVLEGTAQTAGISGGVIVVRNPSSGKDFRAQVTGKDQVTVLVNDAGGQIQ
ncbi:MAG: flagellar basal body P-ring formation chaperone FlgA [Bryobacteraceae bacterium]|jgi:flagella basal body P-ring formation protein FlgA